MITYFTFFAVILEVVKKQNYTNKGEQNITNFMNAKSELKQVNAIDFKKITM